MTNSSVLQKALDKLDQWNAPPPLIAHSRIVGEVAVQLVDEVESLFSLSLDKETIVTGAALHDTGKIVYPNELTGPGKDHEEAGETFLINRGVEPKLARFARTHGSWKEAGTNIEDWLVALADGLWKGKRRSALEQKVIQWVSDEKEWDYWLVYPNLDALFEEIADDSLDRLGSANT